MLGTFIIVTHGRLDGLAITLKDLSLVYFLLSRQLFVLFCQRNMSVNMVVSQSLTWDAHGWDNFIFYNASLAIPLVLNQGNLIGLFGIIGIGTILNYSLFFMGTAIIGSVKGSLMAAVEPISSVVFTVILMHDVFYPMDFLGMLLIIVAVLLSTKRFNSITQTTYDNT